MTGPGYSDEVGEEVHDVIHNAEAEEQRMHGRDAMTEEDPGPTAQKGTLGDAPQQAQAKGEQQKESTMDKIKDALNMKK